MVTDRKKMITTSDCSKLKTARLLMVKFVLARVVSSNRVVKVDIDCRLESQVTCKLKTGVRFLSAVFPSG